MSNLNHYFLAISLSDNVKLDLNSWSQALHALPFQYKEWVHENDFHITLKFLGGVDDKQLERLDLRLRKNSPAFSPFPLKGGEVGTFGPSDSPRVLWAGIESTPTLFSYQSKVDQVCFESGFPRENRTYRPHITIAKKWRGGFYNQSDLPELPRRFFEVWNVDHFVLYQIHPSRKPKYEPIRRYDFGK